MGSAHNMLLDGIYGAVADPSRWSQTLACISDHLHSDGGMLVYSAPVGGRTLLVTARLSEEHSAIYRQHYVWNPWSIAMKGVPFGKAVSADSLIEPGTMARTAFYADVLAPQGQVDILNISCRALARDGGVGGFGFSLSPRGVAHREEGVRRLQRLAPHLSRALEAGLRLAPLADGTRHLARVMQLMPSPALLLDAKGHISQANAAAEALLCLGDGLTIDRGGSLQLAAALPAESAALSRALVQALAVAAGTGVELGEPLRLSRPSGAPPLLVLPVPLPPPAFEFWNLVEPARVLVLIIDPTARSPAAAAAIRTSFGLTASEARVAVLVGSGLSGPQTAAMLGVSLATVKTHLKRCFGKTGVHSQVGLARILAALPVSSSVAGGWSW